MARTFQFDDFVPQQHPNCAACEELLTDAIDGLLSGADQVFFDDHVAGCAACMEKLTETRRGAAWLDLLKMHRPEPSSELVERILAKTSGEASGTTAVDDAFVPLLAGTRPANLLPFAAKPVSRFTRFTRVAMEPRFAMTAAMAFFSIALTLNLTGVRLDQLHASDLMPANLKRTYYQANASAVRYYDNLRVVHVLESRVDDIRQSQADDRVDHQAPAAKPGTQQNEQKKQDAPQGSSRREEPLPASPAVLRSSFGGNEEKVRLNITALEVASTGARTKTEGGLA